MIPVKSSFELKKGMRILVENSVRLEEKGFTEVKGEVTSVDHGNSFVSFKCDQTDSLESVSLSQGKVWILD